MPYGGATVDPPGAKWLESVKIQTIGQVKIQSNI